MNVTSSIKIFYFKNNQKIKINKEIFLNFIFIISKFYYKKILYTKILKNYRNFS